MSTSGQLCIVSLLRSQVVHHCTVSTLLKVRSVVKVEKCVVVFCAIFEAIAAAFFLSPLGGFTYTSGEPEPVVAAR